MNFQNITQGFGQTTVGARSRRLRSVGRTRQQEALKQLSVALLKLLPFVVLFNIALALAIDRVDQDIAGQEHLLHGKKQEKQIAIEENKRLYTGESVIRLAGERLKMAPVLQGHHGYFDKRSNRFVFN